MNLTVSQLIEVLQGYPPDAHVQIVTPLYQPVTAVVRRPETGSVCLIGGPAEE
jgi:hypothetical protein